MIQTKRVYDEREPGDGRRLLVMRYWPRGVRKTQVDAWQRELAPSAELIKAFKAGKLSWPEFAVRYRREMRLQGAAITALRAAARHTTITLLCGCPDEAHCHRGLLRRLIARC